MRPATKQLAASIILVALLLRLVLRVWEPESGLGFGVMAAGAVALTYGLYRGFGALGKGAKQRSEEED